MTCIMVQFAQYDRELDQERSKDFHLAQIGWDKELLTRVVHEAEKQARKNSIELESERREWTTVRRGRKAALRTEVSE